MLLRGQGAQLQWVLFVHKAADWYQTPAQTEVNPAAVGIAIASHHSGCARIPAVV